MKYTAKLRVYARTLKRINRLLDIDQLEDLTDEERIALDVETNYHARIGTAFFDNGKRMSFDLCSGSSNYWVDIALKNSDWSIVVDFEPAFELSEGEHEFVVGDDVYVVHVVKY